MTVKKKPIFKRNAKLMDQRLTCCKGDQKKLFFSLIHSLFGSKKITMLPEYTSSFTLASLINMFFFRESPYDQNRICSPGSVFIC